MARTIVNCLFMTRSRGCQMTLKIGLFEVALNVAKGDVEAVLTDNVGWTGTSVPTEIFKDLLDAKKIPDPHIDQHEKGVQWVGEVDWLYRTRFTVTPTPESQEKAVMAFDGLDTFA